MYTRGDVCRHAASPTLTKFSDRRTQRLISTLPRGKPSISTTSLFKGGDTSVTWTTEQPSVVSPCLLPSMKDPVVRMRERRTTPTLSHHVVLPFAFPTEYDIFLETTSKSSWKYFFFVSKTECKRLFPKTLVNIPLLISRYTRINNTMHRNRSTTQATVTDKSS